ncbi:MAG: hypothetical protein H6514_20725 [Acidimicrobiaceae bacterium]|nr:hypothetical protein [Acidimicrobiaceae bacterium]
MPGLDGDRQRCLSSAASSPTDRDRPTVDEPVTKTCPPPVPFAAAAGAVVASVIGSVASALGGVGRIGTQAHRHAARWWRPGAVVSVVSSSPQAAASRRD